MNSGFRPCMARRATGVATFRILHGARRESIANFSDPAWHAVGVDSQLFGPCMARGGGSTPKFSALPRHAQGVSSLLAGSHRPRGDDRAPRRTLPEPSAALTGPTWRDPRSSTGSQRARLEPRDLGHLRTQVAPCRQPGPRSAGEPGSCPSRRLRGAELPVVEEPNCYIGASDAYGPGT